MKQNINLYAFRDAFERMDCANNFPGGLSVLFDYLEEYEESTGEEIELDVIGLCCDFCQLSYADIERDYCIEIDCSDCTDDDERAELRKEEVTEYLNENTIVVGEVGDDEIIFACF